MNLSVRCIQPAIALMGPAPPTPSEPSGRGRNSQPHDLRLRERPPDCRHIRMTVWFSEVTPRPGIDMRVAIDRGLVSSRIGIVLVTLAMLDKLRTDPSWWVQHRRGADGGHCGKWAELVAMLDEEEADEVSMKRATA